ncbi:MAG: type VI secretion system tip protein VgrG [Sulfurovum sp.]|nr:type VI secretion system tip protein VgrG [Sulfurovum sp.]
MHEKELLQKIKARLTLLSAKPNPETEDGTYSTYKIEGEHTLGKPYEYAITFSSLHKLEVEDLVDTDVHLFLQDEKNPSHQRDIYGKIFRAKADDKVADQFLYTLTVVHPMYYLGLDQRYEIFQEMTPIDIITDLLGRYAGLLNIDFGSNIPPASSNVREYTTQYKQSDLEFVQMLCEQEGMTLRMQSDAIPYPTRLTHINEAYTKLPDEHWCNYTHSKNFSVTHTQKDYYEFENPSLEYMSADGAAPLSQSFGDNGHSSQLRNDLQIMIHRDRLEHPRDKDIKNYIKQQSLKSYSDSERIVGKSLSLFTEAGHGGVLFDQKIIKRTEAIFTKVKLKGLFPNALDENVQDLGTIEQYEFIAEFEATPPNTIYIPPYNIIKPIIPSSVTAVVSDGSPLEALPSMENTIDIDELGRIRVIFYFEPNYPTSCYIRFTNFSAGNGWGSQFIPRVNTEVIVNFLNGDPDCPIAIGSLYNGNNKIPYDVPAMKTKSYIKTQSMPGTNETYNLLLFEDKAGEELVHMRAELDHKLHVLRDSQVNIDRDETMVIGRDRDETVGHDDTIRIGHDRTEIVGHDEDVTIVHNQTLTVGNNQRETVGANKFVTVVQNHIENVLMFKAESIIMGKALTVLGWLQTAVGAYSTEEVGDTKITKVGNSYELDVAKKIVIKTGASSLVMDKDGTIVLSGKNVKIIGSEHVEICSEVVDIN